MAEEQLVTEDSDLPPPYKHLVWRIGAMGQLISSETEEHAASYAEHNLHIIFFFADFDTQELSHDNNTVIKVYQSMRDAGISEDQATTAMHNMQKEGLYFRDAVHAPEI